MVRAARDGMGQERMTVGSLFSGVGGFDEGFRRAGFDVRWQCEIDPACRDVLCRNFPECEVIYTNVCTVDRHMLEPVDILIGGFPCQDLSVAGRRAGLGGARSGLFYEFTRIIGELRPRIAVFENVPGLLSSNGGDDFAAVLAELANIGAVDIAWCVLDAQWFGVPQRRRRVFLVADFGGECAAEILALPEGLQGHPAPRRETGQGVAASLTSGSHPNSNDPGRRREDDVNIVVGTLAARDHKGVGSQYVNEGKVIAQTLTAHEAKGGDPTTDNYIVTHALTGEGFDASEDGTGRGTPLVVGEVAPTLRGGAAGGTTHGKRNGSDHMPLVALPPAVAFAQNQRGELRTMDVAAQLTTGGGKPGEGYPAAMTAMGVRRLMPVECERLMGWQDGWTAFGASGKEMSDSTRYRMCGNGVATPVAEWLARRIAATLRGEGREHRDPTMAQGEE